MSSVADCSETVNLSKSLEQKGFPNPNAPCFAYHDTCPEAITLPSEVPPPDVRKAQYKPWDDKIRDQVLFLT